MAPIYANPQSGLSVPSLSVLVPLEIIRGATYAVVLTAVFASLRKQKEQKNLSFKAAAALLFIPGGFLPLLSSLAQVSVLTQVAPYHSLELLADPIVYGYIATRILANGCTKDPENEESGHSRRLNGWILSFCCVVVRGC